MKVFEPLRTYSSPSGRAVECMDPKASEPEPGSVIAQAPIVSIVSSGRAQRSFWATVPRDRMAAAVSPIDTPMAVTMPGLQRDSSMMGMIWNAAAFAASWGSRPSPSSVPPASPSFSWAICRSNRSRAIASIPKVENNLRMMSYGGRSPCSRSRWCGTSSFSMKSRTAARTICCSSVHSITAQLWQALREMASCRDPQGRSEEFCVSFRVKDRVVYPHHGAAIIEATEKRATPDGEPKDFFVLRMTHGDLVLKVPVDKAEEIGMRYPISVEDVEDVFEVLAKKDVREPTNWSRRFKNHQEKLKSGDVYQVAEVVRNLALRDNDKGLSAGEKSMFVKARQVLVSELAFALDISEDDAMDRLAKTIA